MDTIEISRTEYDRLRQAEEDLADLRAYDAASAALARGEDELIPAEYARRLIEGESPLRVYRELRGLKPGELGAKAGVHRVQIADIEAGRRKGSLATVGKLAAALGVSIDDLA